MKQESLWIACIAVIAGVLTFASYSSQALIQPGGSATLASPAVKAGQSGTGTGIDQSPAKKTSPAFDYSAMSEAVVIQLAEEPRIHSPIRTQVTAQPQTYNLYFREAMDRPSVEQALRTNASIPEQLYQQLEPAPQFTLKWHSDQHLQVIARVPQTEDSIGKAYLLSVAGASTKSGHKLEQAPQFIALISKPEKLWRVAVDQAEPVTEKLVTLEEPYLFDSLLADGKSLLLTRFTDYCECDAPGEKLYAIYDLESHTMSKYPVALQTTYSGPGSFVADNRGFFYRQPEGVLPKSDTETAISLPQHVYGASFTKDRTQVIMAVGQEEHPQSVDLLLYDLQTGEQQQLAKAVKGTLPVDELFAQPQPVTFYDDGTHIYFYLNDEQEQQLRYAYSRTHHRIESWAAPLEPYEWPGFIDSDDSQYRYYYNAGLYRQSEKVLDNSEAFASHWIPGSNQLLLHPQIQHDVQSEYNLSLKLFDVEKQETVTIGGPFAQNSRVVGVSADGKWIYLSTTADQLSE